MKICKCKLDSKKCYLNQKWNNEICQCECKNYRTCKKGYSWNPNIRIFENGKNLKIIAGDSSIVCDEIIYVMDIVSINVANTISKNAAITVSINCHNKKVRY